MAKEMDAEMRVDDALDSEGSEPRVYELGFHLDPELPTEEVKKAYQIVHDRISAKGPIVAEAEPQKIQLAYTISRQETSGRRDFDSAYFAWIVYETTPELHAEILKDSSSDKHIIRFIDLITTKDAARHALEMREIALKTEEPAADPEALAGAELDAAIENVVI